MNPLTALLAAPSVLPIVGSAIQTTGDAASSFAGALADALGIESRLEITHAPADSESDQQDRQLQSLLEDIRDELAQLSEAAGALPGESASIRVSLADGSIGIAENDAANGEHAAALRNLLGQFPSLEAKLREAAMAIARQGASPSDGLIPAGGYVELGLNTDGDLTAQVVGDEA
jgi:hypothetical protein